MQRSPRSWPSRYAAAAQWAGLRAWPTTASTVILGVILIGLRMEGLHIWTATVPKAAKGGSVRKNRKVVLTIDQAPNHEGVDDSLDGRGRNCRGGHGRPPDRGPEGDDEDSTGTARWRAELLRRMAVITILDVVKLLDSREYATHPQGVEDRRRKGLASRRRYFSAGRSREHVDSAVLAIMSKKRLACSVSRRS